MAKIQRVITLGSRRQLTLDQYVQAWKTCKAAPPGTEFKESLCDRWPESRERILRQFMQGLHDRINSGVPYVERGR